MKSLSDKITKHKCQKHGGAYAFLCIEEICKHKQRMMCSQCVNLINTKGLINIKNAFEFLDRQQIEENAQIYQCQATLWQKFQRIRDKIMDLLQTLESLMETFIRSIVGNGTIKMIKTNYFDSKIDNQDIKELGKLLNGQIMINEDGQYQFPTNTDFKQQDGYIKSNEILEVYEQASNLLSTKLNQIKIEASQKSCKEEQHIKTVDIRRHPYQPSKTIFFDSYCSWLCFNHNETQIVAAVEKSIVFINKSQEGQWSQSQQQLVGHSECILQVKFNHNSTQLASCSMDKLIIIWDKQQNGKWSIQDKLSKHTEKVCSISYNHDSTILVSGSLDQKIQIHVLENGHWLWQQQLTEHNDYVYDVCFNHNSKLLASAVYKNSIALWECNNIGKWIINQTLTDHVSGVFKIQFNKNSTLLLSAGFDNSIKIWSVDDYNIWKCRHTLIGHAKNFRSVCFNAQSNMIVSASRDRLIKIWRINNENNWDCTQTINEHRSWVNCAIISNDSTMIVSGSHDNTIQIYK